MTVYHNDDNDDNQECINCDSENIEHINKSIEDWKDDQADNKNLIENKVFCICQKCNYEEEHKKGVPCFCQTCPNCNIPLIRKSEKSNN